MVNVKKIGVFTFAKFQSVLFALLGLIAGTVYSFGGLIIDVLVSLGWIASSETPGLSFGTVLAFGALIGMPIIFAILGFLLGIVEAIIFNQVAKLFGGINVDFN